jgi:regulator of protease activity HflC (stomatin/prohibitin superfamily)
VPWQVFAAVLLLIVTTFGRPGSTLTNGLHWKAPWQSVTEMNGTIQIDNH